MTRLPDHMANRGGGKLPTPADAPTGFPAPRRRRTEAEALASGSVSAHGAPEEAEARRPPTEPEVVASFSVPRPTHGAPQQAEARRPPTEPEVVASFPAPRPTHGAHQPSEPVPGSEPATRERRLLRFEDADSGAPQNALVAQGSLPTEQPQVAIPAQFGEPSGLSPAAARLVGEISVIRGQRSSELEFSFQSDQIEGLLVVITHDHQAGQTMVRLVASSDLAATHLAQQLPQFANALVKGGVRLNKIQVEKTRATRGVVGSGDATSGGSSRGGGNRNR